MGYLEVVRELIAAGANVNAEVDKCTALRYASGRGRVEIVRALLTAGADTSIVAYGTSILTDAARYGHIDVIRILLEAGMDPTRVDSLGRTARQELTIFNPHLACPAP